MDRFPDLNTFALRCFITLADTGHFTEAAARVLRTQSAVSQQIAKLEEMAGSPLFDRRERIARLTPAGEIFYAYAQKILKARQELFMQFHQADMMGEVRLGVPEDFATLYLPEILASFAAAYPRIALHVECDLTIPLTQKFQRGDYDLVILKELGSAAHPSGISVWTEHLEWVVSPRFVMDIAGQPLPLVLSPQPCIYRGRALEALDRANIPWRVVYSSPSFAGTVAAVKAGLGITVFPNRIIPDPLVRLRKKILPNLRQTQIILKTQSQTSPTARALAQYIVNHLR